MRSSSPGDPSPSPAGNHPPLRCPNGRACRLTLVNARERLVHCAPAEACVCPNVMSFGETRYCRALFTPAPAPHLA